MKTKLIRSIALVLAMIMCMAVGAFAATNLQEIKAYLNYDLAIRYDGELQTMYDANGKQVVPISYNGTTYLPIRAVGNMMGIDVLWDGENYQVLLGKTGQAIDFIENFTPYAQDSFTDHCNYKDSEKITIGKDVYNHYILLGRPYVTGSDPQGVYYDLGGKYDEFTFEVYTPDKNMTIELWGDNDTLIDSFEVVGKNLPSTHTVSVKGVQQFMIRITNMKCPVYILDAYVN